MAKAAATLIFVLSALICVAQQAELDSLQKQLARYTKDDTVKINLLNDIAFDYMDIAPAKGIQAAGEAAALAKKLNVPSKLATAYNYTGLNYSAQGDDTIALNWFKQALILQRQMGNILRVGTTYNNIAMSLVNLSRYAEALDYHNKAFAIFDSLHEAKRMAGSLNNIGVIYLYVADYDKALEYYFKALTLAEKMRDSALIKNACTNIGLVYDHLSNFNKALEYHSNTMAIARAGGDRRTIANALSNMGNVYHDMDSSAAAIELYKKALAISEEIGDKRGIAANYGNLGIVYNSMGYYGQALAYIQQSLALNTAAEDKQRMAGDFYQLAKLYAQAPGAFLQQHRLNENQRFARVIEYNNQAVALAKEVGSVDMQRDAWQALSNVYEQLHNAPRALQAYKQYIVFRDSVINEETKLSVARREMQFDFEKREAAAQAASDKKQAVAAAEIHRQHIVRNIIAGGAAALCIAAVTSFIFYKKRRDALETQKEAEFNMQVADTEMKALRAQMNPHFIFNSLNSISDYVHRHDTETATNYTAKFAKLMRMILEHSEKKEVTIAEDLEALELYMQLEQLRLRNKFTYTIRIDDIADIDNTFIPPLLLQPFVENSIWHGIAGKQGNGHISINLLRKDDMLLCMVEDDGIGKASLTGKVDGKRKSFGINITKERIAILNRQKGINANVQVTYHNTGTVVQLTLPYETDV